MITPHENAASPKGWNRNDAERSRCKSERADRVIPHSGQGTPVIVNIGHGGMGENGRAIPTTARPKQPTTSQRSGRNGIAIDAVNRERFAAHPAS
jgi:hypothetical protein